MQNGGEFSKPFIYRGVRTLRYAFFSYLCHTWILKGKFKKQQITNK